MYLPERGTKRIDLLEPCYWLYFSTDTHINFVYMEDLKIETNLFAICPCCKFPAADATHDM
jgi:hypothetical protein